MGLKKSYYIETYGCEMNKSDSIDIALSLGENGFEKAEKEKEADVIVLNTCAVRENAEERICGRLGYYRALKDRYKKDVIIVLAGCMAQEKGINILKTFPEINIVSGTSHGRDIPRLLKKYAEKKKPLVMVEDEGYEFSPYTGERAERYRAWVNIIKGCSNFCSYCIVPFLRGPEVSKESFRIIDEIQELAIRGVTEVTLLGQNVNAYGKDNNDIPFIELLERINNLKGIRWIRYLTSHPKDFKEDIIKRIAHMEKLCRHIHLPLQSGSNRILSLMNRKYNVSHYMALIGAVRKYIPEASITTDLITGFPGERDRDFRQTLKVVNEVQFDDAFTYRYSERPFTKATEIHDKVEKEVAKERLKELIALQRSITLSKIMKEIGKRREVLIIGRSRRDKGESLGKTEQSRMVVVPGEIPAGSYVDVYITGIMGNTLRGVLVKKTQGSELHS